MPVKYGSSRRPVSSETRSSSASRSRSQMAVVRRSCQTIAGRGERSVRRSHTTAVSRWSVIPMQVGCGVGAGERLAAGGDGRRPDVVGLVLDPAGAGEQLRELAVAAGQDAAVLAHDQRGHPGRTCVDREYRHGVKLTPPTGGRRAPLLLRHRVHRGRHHHRPRLHRRRRRDRPRVLRGEHPVRPATRRSRGCGATCSTSCRRRPTRRGAAASASARSCCPSSPRPARRSSSGPGSAPTTTSRSASSGARCRRSRGRSRASPASCASAGTTWASRALPPKPTGHARRARRRPLQPRPLAGDGGG